MSQPQNILLFGATGQIGTFILSALLSARKEFNRIAIFTSSSTASTKADHLNELKKQDVEVIVGDINDEDAIKKAYEGIDTIISALGRTSLQSQIPLINIASSTPNVKWFLPSEYGTDIAYSPASASEKPHQNKLAVRKVLESIPSESLAYTYVVTGPFAEFYLHYASSEIEEAGGWDVKGKKSALVEGEREVSLTTMKDVGTLVLYTLRHPEAVKNKALHLNSFTTTPAQIQAEFERQVSAGSPWSDITRTSLPRLRELESQAWEAGKPHATVLTLRRIWAEGGTLYEQRDNGLIGEPALMDLKEVVANEINRQLRT